MRLVAQNHARARGRRHRARVDSRRTRDAPRSRSSASRSACSSSSRCRRSCAASTSRSRATSPRRARRRSSSIGGRSAAFRAAIRAIRTRAPSGATRRSRTKRRSASAALPSIYAVTQHVANGATFKYKDRSLNAGIEYYTPNWTDVDGGDIYPGPQLHARGERRRRARRDRERQAGASRCSATPIRSTRRSSIDGRAVHRDRPLSLHGEPDGHADVGGRRRFAEGDRSARDGPAPHEPLGARQQPHRQAARRRRASTTPSTTSRRICAAHRGLRPRERTNFAVVTQDKLLDDLQPAVRHVLRRRHRAVVGRTARRRHRRDRDHDDLGHRAHARDRRAQGARRDARHDSLAVPRRGGDAHRHSARRSGSCSVSPRSLIVRTAWPSIPASTPLSSVVSALGRERGHGRAVRHAAGRSARRGSIRSSRCGTSSAARLRPASEPLDRVDSL